MILKLKIVRKNTKPPVWRRVLVPAEITFDVLAVILETVTESEFTEDFEFEIKKEKVRIIGNYENCKIIKKAEFRYLSSADNLVFSFINPAEKFTFLLRNTEKIYPEYIIEFEDFFSEIKMQDSETGEKESFLYPVIIKSVMNTDDEFWTEAQYVNEKMKETMLLKKSEVRYVSYSECLEQIKCGGGISIYDPLCSRELSADTVPDGKSDIFERLIRFMDETGYDSKTGKTSVSDKKIKSLAEEMLGDLTHELNRYSHEKLVSEENIFSNINSYTLESQNKIAESAGYTELKSSDADFLKEFGMYMLRPEIMKKMLLEISVPGMDCFEKILNSEYYTPSDEEIEEIVYIQDLGYVTGYNDNTYSVPPDVKKVYNKLKSEGYAEYHRKMDWLNTCLNAFCYFYLCGPVDVLYQMYRKNSIVPDDFQEFRENLKTALPINGNYPENLNGRLSDRLISHNFDDINHYEFFEKIRPAIDFYIPDMQEISVVSEKGYPAYEPSFKRLYNYFDKECGMNEEKTVYYCVEAYLTADSISSMQDFIRRNDDLQDFKLVSKSGKPVNKLRILLDDVFRNTRKPSLKGHTFSEVTDFKKNASVNKSVKNEELIIQVLNQSDTLGKQIIKSVKTAPNDKCPCGSGKKYKKCCGMK